jgi:hypothetical protein
MNGIATGGMQWILEVVLVLLLAGTLFHAIRLERALGVLKRDRAALEALVAEFNASSHAAEQGVERLREAADGAGRQIARQIDAGGRLKDDLLFLNDRGEKLADRLDRLVRAARGLDQPEPQAILAPEPQAILGREPQAMPAWAPPREAEPPEPRPAEPADAPRVRSQAERDLLRALRLAR